MNETSDSASVVEKKKGSGMELLFVVGFLVLWIALQAWILPKFGVST